MTTERTPPVAQSSFFKSVVFNDEPDYTIIFQEIEPLESLRDAVESAAALVRKTVAVAAVYGTVVLGGLTLTGVDMAEPPLPGVAACAPEVRAPQVDEAKMIRLAKERGAFAARVFVHTPHPMDDDEA